MLPELRHSVTKGASQLEHDTDPTVAAPLATTVQPTLVPVPTVVPTPHTSLAPTPARDGTSKNRGKSAADDASLAGGRVRTRAQRNEKKVLSRKKSTNPDSALATQGTTNTTVPVAIATTKTTKRNTAPTAVEPRRSSRLKQH